MRLVLLLLLLPGCIATLRREEVQGRMLREHYATTTSLKELRELWESLDPIAEVGCLSITRPCRVPEAPLCMLWGKERTCFDAMTGRIASPDRGYTTFTEQWVYEQLDPQFASTKDRVAEVADAEVSKEETDPVDANSFWATTRAVVQVPVFSIGQQFQAGYRRWLEHYLLVGLGAGYERTYTAPRGFGEPRDSILFTARFELSVLDEKARKRLNLPPVSAYVGLTGVLGVTPTTSWMTRAFVGITTSVVPISIELGYGLGVYPQATLAQFYIAAGLAI